VSVLHLAWACSITYRYTFNSSSATAFPVPIQLFSLLVTRYCTFSIRYPTYSPAPYCTRYSKLYVFITLFSIPHSTAVYMLFMLRILLIDSSTCFKLARTAYCIIFYYNVAYCYMFRCYALYAEIIGPYFEFPSLGFGSGF
jgi:hypothetical protein